MSLRDKIFYAADSHLKDVTLSLMKQDTGAVLLDLGCGDCQFTKRLIEKVKPSRCYAVDSVQKRLEYAKSIGCEPVSGDLNIPLPLESNYFDVIHAGDVIEHLNNTDIFVKEIKRILKPGGYAVITTPNLASWHNVACLMVGLQPPTVMVSDEIYNQAVPEDKDMPKHRRVFTHAGLAGLLRYHGLKIDQVSGAGFYPWWGLLQSLAISLDYQHSAYVVVKAVKV